MEKKKKFSYGAWRIRPGGLAVSRSFGDQLSKIWNNKNMTPDVEIHDVVTSRPDVIEKDFDDSMDFVFLGTDGIFDVLSN